MKVAHPRLREWTHERHRRRRVALSEVNRDDPLGRTLIVRLNRECALIVFVGSTRVAAAVREYPEVVGGLVRVAVGGERFLKRPPRRCVVSATRRLEPLLVGRSSQPSSSGDGGEAVALCS